MTFLKLCLAPLAGVSAPTSSLAAMNQTSRTDETIGHPGWNQNPPFLNADATTRHDFNGMINLRERQDNSLASTTGSEDGLARIAVLPDPDQTTPTSLPPKGTVGTGQEEATTMASTLANATAANDSPQSRSKALTVAISVPRFFRPLVKFASFIGPGFLIAVAYIDPGNYSTDAAAGASSKYALLFVVLMSNLFAVFLQSLCIKLGSVTGLNLAENCRLHLPKWLNICLYLLSEAAIIATDIAEVGSLFCFTDPFPLFSDIVSGDRLSHCVKSITQHSLGGRMRHNCSRCLDSFDLLSATGIDVGSSCFRIFRYVACACGCDMFLHSTIVARGTICGRSFPRLPSFLGGSPRLWVSFFCLSKKYILRTSI